MNRLKKLQEKRAVIITEMDEAIENNDELDLRKLEVRTITIGEAKEGNVSAGSIKKTTYVDYILKRLSYISPFYGAMRKEILTSVTNSIPVQKNKISKFVNMD